MNCIAGFEHGAVARQGAVHAEKLKFRAEVTRSVGISFDRLRNQQRHFASILLALDKSDGVLPSRNKGIGILERAADLVVIN